MLTPFQVRAARALAGTPFFAELGEAGLRWVHRTSVRAGEVLFEKDDESEHLFGLVGGQLKLFSPGLDGRAISLSLIAPGEILGELGIADGAARATSVMALQNSELATIHRRDLEPLMADHPNLHDALGRACAAAVRRLTQRAEDAAFLSIEARVEKTLVELAGRIGETVLGGTRIRLRQQDLADLLGTSRESVSRVLTSTGMQSKVELRRGSIVLLSS